MKRTMTARVAALLIAAAAGCSNGASVPLAPGGTSASGSMQSSAAKRDAHARFEIRVPRRKAHYVSPNTQSVSVAVNGGAPVVRNLTATSPGCTALAGGTQCRFNIDIPSGTDAFVVKTYSALNGGGSTLSQGAVTKSVKRGALAIVPITLDGVVASISVALGSATPPAGTAATTPVYVTAFDASGAMIAGPGTYNVSIALTDSDTTGITTVSSAPLAGPGSSGTLAYTGASLLHATIGATASGVTNVTPATFEPRPTIFASFDIPAAFGNNSASLAIGAGPDGNVYYSVYGGGSNGIVKLAPTGASTSFIAGSTAGLMSGAKVQGITTGPDGNVWFTDSTNDMIGKITPGGTIAEYAAPAGMCPNRIVSGPSGDNGLWFTSNCSSPGSGAIGHITTGGTSPYSYTIPGRQSTGILVGKDGNLYLVDLSSQEIGQAIVSGGTVSSYSEFPVGPNPIDGTIDNAMYGLAQTGDGELWFANQGCVPSTIGSIQIGKPFTSSTVHQFITKNGCSLPTYMTASPDGSEIFAALWSYPTIEIVTPQGVGDTPLQALYTIQASTPNAVQQNLWDVTIGPNGNVWATNNFQTTVSPANVVEMAY